MVTRTISRKAKGKGKGREELTVASNACEP